MAYDAYEAIYHLTPNGWSSADEPPADRIGSWELSVYQASGWSKEQRSWKRIWMHPDWTEEQLADLYKKLPPPVRTESDR